MKLTTSSRLRTDTRGAVIAEQLIVFIPTLFFFLATFQLTEVMTGHLVVQRAAVAAARAATVILPDDPARYGGTPVNEYAGARREAVVRAAQMILSANPHFAGATPEVSIEGAHGTGPVRATVRASFHCFASFVNVICGGGTKTLQGMAIDAYNGADYVYD